MSVVRDVEDDRIKVEPEDVDVNDFLEYAELAILRFGWRQGERTKVTEDDMVQVAEQEGLSLHDAIGYTNVMLGGAEQGKPTGKDDLTRAYSGTRGMREEMTKAVIAALPSDQTDRTFNDEAKDVEEVLGILRTARGAA